MPAAKTARRSAGKPMTPKKQSKLNFGAAAASSSSDTKTKKPANGNILNFFKKVEDSLFLDDGTFHHSPLPAAKDDIYGLSDEDHSESTRFNEETGTSKRRKLSHDSEEKAEVVAVVEQQAEEMVEAKPPQTKKLKRPKGRGPFLDDSESEDEEETGIPTVTSPAQVPADDSPSLMTAGPVPLLREETSVPPIPPLKQEDSVEQDFHDLEDGFEGEFDDEDVENGEEYREMRFMQEQLRLEAEEAGNYSSDDVMDTASMNHGITQNCPLCDASLEGINPDQAAVHVNACLDGTPLPIPTPSKAEVKKEAVETEASDMSKRFSKAAVPRPGQANPIELGGGKSEKATSVFSKLMSGHAEDAAWATAAASEHDSRGKPAYQRTCPFYKIMPGFSICVDAFRYGAVQGCNAYFLSHFHSDHYIGLTANWSHGPIYCSKVTGSLVKQQLRTAAQWVVELEFEKKVQIPGTEGATVTMLPANHCPGSSLFLFEKTVGKGPGSKTQRILHCGDFRACPAQVTHPLLKPDTVDSVSGKTKQQKIDVCYLDTTYLNPRYSFPPQDDVINACADFCKTISGDPDARDDAYDALQREKGSVSVSKFFTKEIADGADLKKEGGLDQDAKGDPRKRLLVVCGTYSIGKERICKAIALALGTKIFASASKIRICKQLGDPELSALLTTKPHEAQVHMQMLMEIRAETLQEYLNSYKPHFSRIVGLRPSGWNFRNPSSTAKSVNVNLSPTSVPSTQILHGPLWKTKFGPMDFVAQRGSTKEAMCFGVPYSEHSSFRELALFVMSLRIEKVVPTVNVGSEVGRKRMKAWLDRWMSERRRGGIVRCLEDDDGVKVKQEGEKQKKSGDDGLWDGKDGRGGGVYW